MALLCFHCRLLSYPSPIVEAAGSAPRTKRTNAPIVPVPRPLMDAQRRPGVKRIQTRMASLTAKTSVPRSSALAATTAVPWSPRWTPSVRKTRMGTASPTARTSAPQRWAWPPTTLSGRVAGYREAAERSRYLLSTPYLDSTTAPVQRQTIDGTGSLPATLSRYVLGLLVRKRPLSSRGGRAEITPTTTLTCGLPTLPPAQDNPEPRIQSV